MEAAADGLIGDNTMVATTVGAARIGMNASVQQLAVNDANFSLITATILDYVNEPVTTEGVTINFSRSGPGELYVTESQTGTSRNTDAEGKAYILLKAGSTEGQVVITATAPDLSITGTITINIGGGGQDYPNLNIYPNPLPKDGSGSMTFTGLTDSSVLCIYTLSGKLVRKIEQVTNGTISWNGTNTDTNPITPGLYIFTLTDADGQKRSGKIVIR